MFIPDYKNVADAARNIRPKRIPLYEHNVSDVIMEKMTGEKFAHLAGVDESAYFKNYNAFFRCMGYDTVTFEGCVTDVLPHGGALAHPRPGYIDSREKLESYPWEQAVNIYIRTYEPKFAALAENVPEGMKAIGGVGNGVFEICEDLAGYEGLCVMSFEQPELYAEMFQRVGDMLADVWKWFLSNFSDAYCVCRFGDDLGFKSNTLISHDDIRRHVLPQYRRITDLVHSFSKPFLLHSCGCIFGVMDDIIDDASIDAKHSNEDQIAPFSEWVDRYGDRIGNFGGIDTDHLVRMPEDDLRSLVIKTLDYCADGRGGFAFGSGNSIPAYVDPKKYLIMIETARKWRGDVF